jgi:hypothetical protein
LGADKTEETGAELDTRLDDVFGDEDAESEPVDAEKVKEVDDRLDSFFSEDEEAPPLREDDAAPPDPSPPSRPAEGKKPKPKTGTGISAMDVENSTLKNLKSIIFSLEWEISEEVMTRLLEEVAHLEKKHKKDKIAVAFFQLMSALGKYIQKKQADAHPDSIGLITSVYESLERTQLSSDMSEADKKKTLMVELDKYKQLKEQIKESPKKKKAPPKAPAPQPSPAEVVEVGAEESAVSEPAVAAAGSDYASDYEMDQDPSAPATNRDLLNVLIRIQQTLEREFRGLREDLKALKQ